MPPPPSRSSTYQLGPFVFVNLLCIGLFRRIVRCAQIYVVLLLYFPRTSWGLVLCFCCLLFVYRFVMRVFVFVCFACLFFAMALVSTCQLGFNIVLQREVSGRMDVLGRIV